MLAQNEFRDALAQFASGVTPVATCDRDRRPRGFTASAFSALSLDPPMVLVCISTTADSHRAFVAADRYVIHILAAEQEELSQRFARESPDRFSGSGCYIADDGLPAFPGVLARLMCSVHAIHGGGDHTILVGLVDGANTGEGSPMLHYDRWFWSLAERAA